MASNFELINEIDKRDNDFEEIDEFMPTERLPNAPKPVVRRGKEKSYMIIEEFDTNNELLMYLDDHKAEWGISYKNPSKIGMKYYYHCKATNYKKEPHCKAGIVVLHHRNGRFIVSSNEFEHTLHKTITRGIGPLEV